MALSVGVSGICLVVGKEWKTMLLSLYMITYSKSAFNFFTSELKKKNVKRSKC